MYKKKNKKPKKLKPLLIICYSNMIFPQDLPAGEVGDRSFVRKPCYSSSIEMVFHRCVTLDELEDRH